MRKSFQKLSSLIIILAIFCSFAVNTSAATTFQSAREAVDSISVGWNLGNTLDCYGSWIDKSSPVNFETAWGNPKTTKAIIDSVKAQGFNAIRIPITWSQHIDSTGKVDSAWMSRVKAVVDLAYNDGLYVIINVHHDNGEGGSGKVSWMFAETSTYDSVKTKFQGLWKSIATEFNSYGERLLFEGYNEVLDKNNTWNAPGNTSSYTAINNYAQLFVNTVRATGGNNAQRNLIINTYVASHEQSCLDNLKIPTDSAKNHLICEVHVYHPWGFTGTTKTVNWTNVHSNFLDSDKSEINTIISRLKSFSDSKNIPVIIGEFGAEYKNNNDQIAKYAAYFVDRAGKNGIKCFYWDNGEIGTGTTEGGYGIFNRNSLTWKSSISKAMADAAKPYVRNPNGYYVNGVLQTSATGIVKKPGDTTNWYFVKNGIYTKATGIAQKVGSTDKNWYFVKDGIFVKASGIAKKADGSSATWYYVKDGIYVKNTGIAKKADGSDTKWYYVKSGIYTKSTGIAKKADGSDTKWYYVKSGIYTKSTGISKKADSTDTKWYYVYNGVYNKATGIAQKADGSSTTWFYVLNGVYTKTKAIAPICNSTNGKKYYVENGIWSQITGVREVGGIKYTIKSGLVV